MLWVLPFLTAAKILLAIGVRVRWLPGCVLEYVLCLKLSVRSWACGAWEANKGKHKCLSQVATRDLLI